MKLADALAQYDVVYLRKMCRFFRGDASVVPKEVIIEKILVPEITDKNYLFTCFALMSKEAQQNYFNIAVNGAVRKCDKAMSSAKRLSANITAYARTIWHNLFSPNRFTITKIQKYDHLKYWMYLGGLYIRIDKDTDIICDEIVDFVRECISGTSEDKYCTEQLDRNRDMIKMRADYLNRLMEVYGVISWAYAELIFASLYFEPLFAPPFTQSLAIDLAILESDEISYDSSDSFFPSWTIPEEGEYLTNFVIANPQEIIACQKKVDIYIPSEYNELFQKDNLGKDISDIECKQNEGFRLFNKYCADCYNASPETVRSLRIYIECCFTLSGVPVERDELIKSVVFEFIEAFGEVKAKDTLITVLDNIYDNFNNWKCSGYTPREYREMEQDGWRRPDEKFWREYEKEWPAEEAATFADLKVEKLNLDKVSDEELVMLKKLALLPDDGMYTDMFEKFAQLDANFSFNTFYLNRWIHVMQDDVSQEKIGLVSEIKRAVWKYATPTFDDCYVMINNINKWARSNYKLINEYEMGRITNKELVQKVEDAKEFCRNTLRPIVKVMCGLKAKRGSQMRVYVESIFDVLDLVFTTDCEVYEAQNIENEKLLIYSRLAEIDFDYYAPYIQKTCERLSYSASCGFIGDAGILSKIYDDIKERYYSENLLECDLSRIEIFEEDENDSIAEIIEFEDDDELPF